MNGTASEEGICPHTSPPSLFLLFALNQFIHTYKRTPVANPAAAMWAEKFAGCGVLQSHTPGSWP